MQISITRWIIKTKDNLYVVVGKTDKQLDFLPTLRKNTSPALYNSQGAAKNAIEDSACWNNYPFWRGGNNQYTADEFQIVKVNLEFEI